MANSLFVCGIDHGAGSSVVTLGLAACFRAVAERITFFKPVGDGERDQDVAVMRHAHGLTQEPGQLCPLTIEEARTLVSRQRTDELLDRIGKALDRVREGAQFVLIEGINNPRSMSVFDMDINEEIAAHLNAPVLLVARPPMEDEETDIDQLVASVRTTKHTFERRDIEVLGVVVNRVHDEKYEEVRGRITEAFAQADIPLFGVLPELRYLGFPKLDQVARELNGEVLLGEELLRTVATRTIVAAMEPRHVLKYLGTDKTLVITPGDRDDILLAVACAHLSPDHRSVSGVVLTGDITPDASIINLLRDLVLPNFPVIKVATDTYQTARLIDHADRRIRPQDKDKIDTACSAVARNVQHEYLWERLEMPRPKRRKIGSEAFLEDLVEKARAGGRRVVLPEGDEPRTIRAIGKVQELRLCPVTLLGDPERIHAVAATAGVKLGGLVDVIDPRTAPNIDAYADVVVELRKHKKGGMTPEVARQWLDESTIHYGTIMVQQGDADGLVSGAVHSTADTIRPALQMIGVNKELGLASSIFFMALRDRVLVYGDCAIVPDPNAEELAAIAMASARTARAFGIEPRVAMLSYSTGRSGAGDSVDKVTQATQLVHERNPNFPVDGPLQYDAAIDPDVGKLKQPDSPVAGQANVFIFPDLDAGNIAYKAVQRSAGALAVGPVLQGLNKPVNDLSRGCTVDDIVYTIAVTAIQAANS